MIMMPFPNFRSMAGAANAKTCMNSYKAGVYF